MTDFYFYTFLLLTGVSLLLTILRPARLFEYPYFMAAVFAVFILPQAISLVRFPGGAPPEAVESVLLMTVLCLGMCLVGYYLPLNPGFIRKISGRAYSDRLFHCGLLFVIIAYFFNYLIAGMSEEETGGGMWTGKVTIYGFFANLVFSGLAICLTTAIQKRSIIAWIATAAASVLPIQASIFAGRREGTVLFALTILMTLYYQKRMMPPRLAIAGSIVFAALAIPATGTYRGLASQQNWEEIRQLDLVGNFQKFLTEESILELRNAAVVIEATADSGSFDFGTGYWDQLVFRFVPAQLLGQGFKEGLMFHSPDEREDEVAKQSYYIPPGSTVTGMADSFEQFGYLGCLFFLLLAVLFKNLWVASLKPGAVLAQVFYTQISTSAMRAVTHQTVDFLPGFFYNAIFLGLAFLYARQPRGRASYAPDGLSDQSISPPSALPKH